MTCGRVLHKFSRDEKSKTMQFYDGLNHYIENYAGRMVIDRITALLKLQSVVVSSCQSNHVRHRGLRSTTVPTRDVVSSKIIFLHIAGHIGPAANCMTSDAL